MKEHYIWKGDNILSLLFIRVERTDKTEQIKS